ncbi:MAG: hypothetical protein K0S44_1120 [Bacteroidetes bacterium]|jgi:hypothetical protein|nr:hypothetical protein [Bacteroidota bacterium]
MKALLRNKNRLSLKWLGFYIPFTFYFILFAVVSVIGYQWLQTKAGIPDSAFADIFKLLLHFAIVFGVTILIAGFSTALLPFLYMLFKKRKGGINFRISTPPSDIESSKQPINIIIDPVLKPLLGFVKIRLKYGPDTFSDKFSLIRKSQKKLFSTELKGTYYWELPEIREYRIEQAVIYFEDLFQFFSFALPLNTSSDFHTYPLTKNSQSLNASPRKTEETSMRIEEIKKVEGEHINYKNFESNDDVRRIVWKIYAKNKELVVRIPEILDPYASHLYIYASFYTIFNANESDVLRIPFLNYYKTICWSVYKQFQQKGFDTRYIPDQSIPTAQMEDLKSQVRYSISVSKWHKDKRIQDFIKTKDASVVIISSLSDPQQVQQLLESNGNDITFIFVPLTEGLKKQHLGDWIQWLFVQQEKDAMAVYKTSWSISLLRLKIIKNEKRLKELLGQYERSTIIQR